jgi:hypothetical protein
LIAAAAPAVQMMALVQLAAALGTAAAASRGPVTRGPSGSYLESKYSSDDGGRTFYPGWAFAAHGKGGLGYPPIPLSGYPTYDMATSTSAYFLGNDTGVNSAAETAAEAKFGIVGLGWQLSMRDADWHHLEKFEVSFAAEIKAVNPKAKVLVSRNSEVGTVVWDAIRPLLDTPLHAEASGLWVHSENRRNHGQIANGTWDCDNCGLPPKPTAIPYGKLFFNWTSQKFSDWWLHTHIGDAITDETGIDGVYFDCCCGAPPGIPQGAKEKRIFLRRFQV